MSIRETTFAQSDAVTRRTQNIQTVTYYVAFVALGLVMTSLGPTLSSLAEHTGATLSQIGILFTMRSIGALAGSLAGSRLYDHIPGNPVMGVMLLLMVLALAVIPLVPMLWLLSLVMLALGIAESTFDVGGNTLLVWVHRSKVAPYMNGLHFFFGVGAFLSPVIIAQAILLSGDIIWAYWTLALLVLPVALWLLRAPNPIPQSVADGASFRHADNRLVALTALFFFLYVGAEVGFGGWIAAYADTLNLADKAGAAYLTAGFFGAFTLGRLLSIPIVARFDLRSVLVVDLAGCLLSLAVIALWPTSLEVVWLGTLGVGLSMASVFPGMFSLSEPKMSITGKIAGLFFTGGSLGAMSVPWLIGQLFERIQPQAMMGFLFVIMALALAVFWLLAYRFDPAKSV